MITIWIKDMELENKTRNSQKNLDSWNTNETNRCG